MLRDGKNYHLGVRLPDRYAGGVVPEGRDWSEEEYDELTAAFLRSPHGAAYDDEDHRGLIRSLLWFGTDYGACDPLHWSPSRVEILLTDRFPRKVVAEVPYLSKLPRLLAEFIRHAHAQRHVGEHLTAETLDAVDRWTPDYQRLIRSDRPQGAEALARMFEDAADGDADDLETTDQQVGEHVDVIEDRDLGDWRPT